MNDPHFLTLKKHLQSLSNLPEIEWKQFAKTLSKRTLRPGERLVSLDESSDELGFVLKGLLRVYYLTHEGSEYTRNFHAEGEFAGAYSSALRRAPSNVNIEARETTEIVVFRFSVVASLFERHPSWQEIGRKVAESHYLSREKREYELLCLDARARYAAFQKDFAHLQGRLTQVEIAAYLGITPVFLSRLRRKGRGKS